MIIPCKNEREHIRQCIESVREIADEILVADSGSTDGTLEIVRQTPDTRLIEREYITAGDFKNWAIPQATHSWVLILDADERVTAELAAEIDRLLRSGPRQDGYRIYRDNYFLGHHVRTCGWNNDWVLRLFHRDQGRYCGPNDHARIKISSGRVGRLKSRLKHDYVPSYDRYLAKIDRYSRVAAQQWHAQGRRPNPWRLLVKAPWRFFRHYVLQLGFLDGHRGLQIAMLSALYAYLKQARLYELCETAAGSQEVGPRVNQNALPKLRGGAEGAPISGERDLILPSQLANLSLLRVQRPSQRPPLADPDPHCPPRRCSWRIRPSGRRR